jgi:hypothetical protein
MEGELYAYQAAKAVWPVTQWRIAHGLDQIGAPEAAREIRSRTMSALGKAGVFTEAFYVSPAGVVGYREDTSESGHAVVVPAQQKPSKGQAWTASGARNALESARRREAFSTGWQKQMTRVAIRAVRNVPTAAADVLTTYVVDRKAGEALGTARARAMGGMRL